MNNSAELILVSDNVFSGLEDEPFSGYVAIKHDKILKTGEGSVPEDLIDENTKVINLKEKTVLPGFIDGDIFTVPLEKVRDLKVCFTICDGKIVYEGE